MAKVDLIGFSSDAVGDIQPEDTICLLFGEAAQRGDTKTGEAQYKAFNKKIGQIQAEGRKHGLDPAACLVMINSMHGFFWDTIPWGRMDEMVEYIKKFGADSIQIIDPEMHKKLLDCGAYKISSGCADKNFVAGVARVIGNMISSRATEQQFLEYTKTLCNALI
jgi:hypothetical protein